MAGSSLLQCRLIANSYCGWCFLLTWLLQHSHQDYYAFAFFTTPAATTLRRQQLYQHRQQQLVQWSILFAEWNNDSSEGETTQQQYGTEPTTTGLFCNNTMTTLPRLHVGSTTTTITSSSPILGPDTTISLSPEQSHYVTKVMRMGSTKKKKNNQVRLFDGHSGEWLAELSMDEGQQKRTSSSTVMATCIQQLRPQPTTEQLPWLFVAPLKKPRTKLLLEKCTELGVGRIVWIQTDRTDAKNVAASVNSHDKLSIQLVEASEQCERLTIPTLISNNIVENVSNNENNSENKKEELLNVETLLKYWISDDGNNHPGTLLICRERRDTLSLPILKALQTCAKDGGVAFLIGPEGGWSPKEEELFDKYSSNKIQGVSLGPLVLRAETAAMTAVASYMLHNDYQE